MIACRCCILCGRPAASGPSEWSARQSADGRISVIVCPGCAVDVEAARPLPAPPPARPRRRRS